MKFFKNIFMLTFATVAIFFMFGFLNRNIVLAAVANITKIVFTTEQKNIAVNEISGGITIQAKNSSEDPEKMDVSGGKMTISISGGEVSSSATNWENIIAPLTVNSNWTGRTVYYRNSSVGTYIITATLDISGKSWTATQNITVGDSGGNNDVDSTTTATTTSTSTTTVTTTGSGSTNTVYVYSTHYEQEDVSNYVEPNSFEVSAGRERLVYIGSPISFEAKYKKTGDVKSKNPNVIWSFGDGSSITDEKTIHIYKHPGDYNVVLNAEAGDYKAIARTKVKVLMPNIILTVLPAGAVEIFNKGSNEINLYGWKLMSGNINYAFPLDTIISANKSVIFPTEYLKFLAGNSEITLIDASQKIIAQANSAVLALAPEQAISAADFEKFAVEYKRLTQINQPLAIQPVIVTPLVSVTDISKENDLAVETMIVNNNEEEIPLTASVASINNDGFWTKLFHPVRTIRNAFYK